MTILDILNRFPRVLNALWTLSEFSYEYISLGHTCGELLLRQPWICRCPGLDGKQLSKVLWNGLACSCCHHFIEYNIRVDQCNYNSQALEATTERTRTCWTHFADLGCYVTSRPQGLPRFLGCHQRALCIRHWIHHRICATVGPQQGPVWPNLW